MSQPVKKYPLNGTHYTPADDVEMMTDFDAWPVWPCLPVKNADRSLGRDGHGVLLEEHRGVIRIWHANLFEEIDPERTSYTTYANPAAAVADGWKVD